MKIALLIFAVIAILYVSSVVADTEVRGVLTPKQIYNTIDINQNGSIDATEAKEYLRKLGAPEKHLQSIVEEIFKLEDKNKDGVISEAEWMEANAKEIEKINNSNPNGPVASTTNTMSTLSLTNNHFVHVLQSFANSSAAITDDEELLDDVENDDDEYFWLDFSEDSNEKFCNDEMRIKDQCWHKVYYDEDGDYFYACTQDNDSDETICYSVKINFDEDESDE